MYVDLIDGHTYSDDPHPKFTWMRENAPVYFDEPHGVWGFASYEAVLTASKDSALFSNAGGIRPETPALPMMIDKDDPEHLRRRKIVNKGFTPQRVRASEPKLRDVCDAIIDMVCERGECDFVRDIAAPLPMVMIGDMLGVAPEDRDDLLRWSDDMVSATGSNSEEVIIGAANAMIEYQGYATRVLDDRRTNPTDDLMSVLVHAVVDGDRLSEEDLVYETLLILVGGDETTRHVISGGMEQLLLNPGEKAKLVADPSKITVGVEEMLRWVSPIKNMCRTVTRDVTFLGQDLKEGQKCMLLYESANRDENVFAEPFRFDVERHPNEHIAFGFGSHFCLGNSLARLEMRVMFERILERLPDLEFASDPDSLPRRPANFISGLESMPVKFTPSKPLNRSSLS